MGKAYFKKLLSLSKPIRAQFERKGKLSRYLMEQIPFGGVDEQMQYKERSKGLEQLYAERVVLRISNRCPQVCNFCYEIPRLKRGPKALDDKSIRRAVEIIANDKLINSVLTSGGSPFVLGVEKLDGIISALSSIDHVKQIYVAGGRIIFDPDLWSGKMAQMIAGHNAVDFDDPAKSRVVGVSTQFNHPDELLRIPEGFPRNVIHALNEFTSRGISIHCYTTLLKGINDDPETLKRLFVALRQNNVRPYYLVHAMDTPWNSELRTRLQKMVDLAKEIEHLSGQVKPLFIVATAIGKVAIQSNMNLEYETIGGVKHVVLDTPYRADEFRKANALENLPSKVEAKQDGRLRIYYPDGSD
jgi:lysine 2,3-aminomutase